MKAVIQLDTGMCVFYLSEDAQVNFSPTMEVTNNSTVVGNFSAPFLNADNTQIISGMPEINFEYRVNQYRVDQGAWVATPLPVIETTP
jgi:hypothetical protein